MNTEILSKLGLSTSDHDKLPDVVLWDVKRKWLFLVEAVTSHGPISTKRVFELAEQLKESKVGVVYVSALPDMREFKKTRKRYFLGNGSLAGRCTGSHDSFQQ